MSWRFMPHTEQASVDFHGVSILCLGTANCKHPSLPSLQVLEERKQERNTFIFYPDFAPGGNLRAAEFQSKGTR